MDARVVLMESKRTFLVVRYRVMMAVGLFFFAHDALPSKSKSWHFSFAYLNPPLAISTLPLQQAQVNSSFSLSLDPFITVLKPEIHLEITNLSKWNTYTIYIHYIPLGVAYRVGGVNSCSSYRSLTAGARCILYFNVDKSKFKPHPDCGPHIQHHGDEYYLCNSFNAAVNAAVETQISVTPAIQDGLRYDAVTHTIIGTPTRIGMYEFALSARNGVSTAGPVKFQINVNANPNDKPVFKPLYSFAAARPNQTYRLRLMDLIEKRPSFGVTNQVHFRIDPNHTHSYPSWIHLDSSSGTVLEGNAPASDVGRTKELIIIANSNTGGDSEPLLIRIPVAYDPTQKPVIQQGLEFKGAGGALFEQNLRALITDPVADGSLKVILDKVEPAAPWLSISSAMTLIGLVPSDAIGQCYEVTLRAMTSTGGSSEPVTIPLHINTDQTFAPHFVESSKPLPLMYAGQSYLFDFKRFNGISPAYQDVPFNVELADGFENPSWLRIDDNQIIVDQVPTYEMPKNPTLYITMQNRPGGKSAVIPIPLYIMR